MTTATGRDHAHIFMASENNDLLESYMQRHTIILLCGTPAGGKSEFGKYLQEKHNYTYVPMEDAIWPDTKMRSLWSGIFTAKNQYKSVEKFVCYLHETYENVVLDWGFPINQIRVVELLERQWCEIVWLTCSTPIARQRFITRGRGSVTFFDTQIKSIEENDDEFANLSFSGANLREANLKSKVFCESDFSYADLTGASFEDADLRGVNLVGAKYEILELAKARSLRGATLLGFDGKPYINQGDTLDILP